MKIRSEKLKESSTDDIIDYLSEINIKLFLISYWLATWAYKLYLLFKSFLVIFFIASKKYPNWYICFSIKIKKNIEQLLAYTTEIFQYILFSSMTGHRNLNDCIKICFVSLES